MRNHIIGWKHPRTPVHLNPSFDNSSLAWISPDISQDLLIPSPADLSASVNALKALKDNHQHDVTEDEVR